MEEFAKLAYEASLRALDKQEDVVEELRARTTVVLAAASFAVSVGGEAAVRASPIPAAGAVVCSIFALSLSLYVLLPQPRLQFAIHGQPILGEHYDSRNDVAEVYRRLVYDLTRIWYANDVIVGRVTTAFRWSAAALSLEIVLLVAALRGTL